MGLTRAALREKGVTDKETLDFIMEEHANTVEAAKEKATESTEQKMQRKLDDMQSKLDNIPASSDDGGEWKSKHDKIKSEFDIYKQTVETKEANDAKTSALICKLEEDGANPKLIKLLIKEFDLSKIILDGTEVQNWDAISKPIKDGYAELFGITQTRGAEVATPPVNTASTNQTRPSDILKNLNSHRIIGG